MLISIMWFNISDKIYLKKVIAQKRAFPIFDSFLGMTFLGAFCLKVKLHF